MPFLKGSNYRADNCSLVAVRGVPEVCGGHRYFSDLDLKNGVSSKPTFSELKLFSRHARIKRCVAKFLKSKTVFNSMSNHQRGSTSSMKTKLTLLECVSSKLTVQVNFDAVLENDQIFSSTKIQRKMR